jgi:hypothetical protein
MKNILLRAVGVFFIVSVVTSIGWSQTSAPTENDLNTRFSKVLGTDAEKIVQHYYLVKNGGVIEFTAKDPADNATISTVQKYLDAQKNLFEKGKADADTEIYGKVPDGLQALKKLRNEITFFAVNTDGGAALRMFSVNEQARQAIQDFLKFQISEHKTGDPLQVAQD